VAENTPATPAVVQPQVIAEAEGPQAQTPNAVQGQEKEPSHEHAHSEDSESPEHSHSATNSDDDEE